MSDFAVLERQAPKMPGHTCPEIDRAIGAVRSISRELAYAVRHCEHDDTTDQLETIERAVDDLDFEPLRKQNEALREVAEWWRAQAETLCDEIEGLRADSAAREVPARATQPVNTASPQSPTSPSRPNTASASGCAAWRAPGRSAGTSA